MVWIPETLSLALRDLHIDASNFHFLHYRNVAGFLVTAKNSGTHWLRFMLSRALAEQYGLPAPTFSSGPGSDDFIGHPRKPPRWAGTPRIGSSHNLPSRLVGARWLRTLAPLPPAVVLVRDPKDALLSFYSKWRTELGVDLSEFVEGDPSGRRFKADIWWYLAFFNRWGAIARDYPDQTLVVRYEDLRSRPSETLQRIGGHYGISFTPKALESGLSAYDRASVRAHLDRDQPLAVVPDARARNAIAFSPGDHARLDEILAQRLRYDFAYGYRELRQGRRAVA